MDYCKIMALWSRSCEANTGVFINTPVEILYKFAKEVLENKNHFRDVKDFQVKFEHIVNETPVHLTRRKLLERIRFLQEELDEFTEACGFIRGLAYQDEKLIGDSYVQTTSDQDLPLQADALVDMVYVALGSAVMLGLPWQELWDDVHNANMRKIRGVGSRGNKVDCIKPPGWEGPKTLEILVAAGYSQDHQTNIEEHKDDV